MPNKQNKKIRVAINGFGRIGRQFFKVAFERPELEIVAVNDLTPLDNLAYLLEFDTIYGRYDKEIKVGAGKLIVAGKTIEYFSESDPARLPWKNLKIDIAVEATGRFTSYEKAKAHLAAGAQRVVLTAPAKDEGETITSTPNVNEAALVRSKITSNASCTTNAVTPVAAIMLAKVGIKYAILNTVHGYTSSQGLVDGANAKDFRRGRAGALNIVPSTTGAATATAKAIPGMKDKFDGLALRVPTAVGSILDFTFIAERPTSVQEINDIFVVESKKPEWRGILGVTDRPLVSSDILKDPRGAIIDLNLTRVVGDQLVKIMAWYDNEWGYAAMLVRHITSLQSVL